MTLSVVCAGTVCFSRRRSTGKERDAESGNDYFEARYYSSNLGRFISPDWSAKEEPIPYAKMDDPQSLNLYTYVLNHPMTGVDMDGHQCNLNCQWTNDHDISTPQAPGGSANPANSPGLQKIGAEAAGTVETGKLGFNLVGMSGLPGVSEVSALGSAAVSLIQGNTTEAAVSAAAAVPIGGLLGKSGKFADLVGEVGDNIVAHHMPQAALGFTSKAEGGALAITQGEHVATRTFGFRGRVTSAAEAGSQFRQVLARDIRDVRSIAGTKYNAGLQSLIRYYKESFPGLISK